MDVCSSCLLFNCHTESVNEQTLIFYSKKCPKIIKHSIHTVLCHVLVEAILKYASKCIIFNHSAYTILKINKALRNPYVYLFDLYVQ